MLLECKGRLQGRCKLSSMEQRKWDENLLRASKNDEQELQERERVLSFFFAYLIILY
jgi:hypothetical protein